MKRARNSIKTRVVCSRIRQKRCDIFSVVVLVNLVLLERNGIRDLRRHVPDFDRSAKAVKRFHHLPVERRHGHWFERNRSAAAIVRFNQQHVIDKIEVDLQRFNTLPHGPRSQAAYGWVERHIPAMVDPRRALKTHLAHNLHPKLQGGAGGAPRALR